MKSHHFISILLLCSVCRAVAQDRTATLIHFDSISAKGLTLTKGWKFQAGDNPEWAKPEYNDAGWKPIDPVDERHHLKEVKDANIGWFRLNLQVDSSLQGKTVAFIVSGLGASEVYLNGKLVYKFGQVSSNYKTEQTRFFTNRLLSLKFDSHSPQVLAIRYSFHKRNLYLKFTFVRPVFKIVLKKIDQAFADHVKDDNFDATLRSIQVSFYLPLGLLLLSLFLSFRLRKEYLFTGIFCVCMFAAILMHIFALSEPTTVTRSNTLLYITQILYITGALSFLNGTYILYKSKRSGFFYFIMLYGLFSLCFYFISYDFSGLFNTFFFPLINIEFLRINWQAVRRRRPGAWILFATGLFLNISLLCLIWFTINNQQEAAAYLQSVCFIIPGIGLSFFYASEFARTLSALRLRAIEVEKLSHEMIAKEKEKQQILGAQNETLEQQVAERTAALSQSLQELKETQNHLFQREKMASLGELTAGIAHEIQNPLNFINNFSEVNAELIGEMQEEIEKGNADTAKNIARDIQQNFEKISYHGKRADGIVKGMLQHSRSSGTKEPADINKLVDEFLRLAYHGLRMKDKAFEATMKTEYDKSIEKITIAPNDVGRVILNLITNAFYAVNEKRKAATEKSYDPVIFVSTKSLGTNIEIRVRDNGNGIPPQLLDKIFQPFFTTKPTGQGTGLGLSISYDIIKAHNGELEVETKENEFTEFIITLPQ